MATAPLVGDEPLRPEPVEGPVDAGSAAHSPAHAAGACRRPFVRLRAHSPTHAAEPVDDPSSGSEHTVESMRPERVEGLSTSPGDIAYAGARDPAPAGRGARRPSSDGRVSASADGHPAGGRSVTAATCRVPSRPRRRPRPRVRHPCPAPVRRRLRPRSPDPAGRPSRPRRCWPRPSRSPCCRRAGNRRPPRARRESAEPLAYERAAPGQCRPRRDDQRRSGPDGQPTVQPEHWSVTLRRRSSAACRRTAPRSVARSA